MIAQRDAFLDDLFFKAKSDKDIILISVDMGAPSIDKWRQQLSAQFFDMGISEQNAINFASDRLKRDKKFIIKCLKIDKGIINLIENTKLYNDFCKKKICGKVYMENMF